MSAATGIVSRDKILSPYRPIGAFVKTAVTFQKGWALARDASGLFVLPTEVTTLLPGGFADRSLLAAPTGDDTDEANAETGVFSVRMKSGDEFAATDKPAPIYFVNNNEFGKTATSRSIAGLFLSLDNDRPDTHCLAWIGPEGAAQGAALAIQTDVNALATSGTFLCDEIILASAVSTTALKTATLITTDPQTILVAAMSAPGIAALLAHPRNITATGGGTTAHCPTQVVWTGTDIDDNVLTETLALSAGSGVGVKAFKTLVAAVFTGATTGDGSVALGIGGKFGFSKTIKLRANGKAHVIDEMLDAAFIDPSTATIVSAATSPPHGTWAPADPPDGADYIAITFEQDL